MSWVWITVCVLVGCASLWFGIRYVRSRRSSEGPNVQTYLDAAAQILKDVQRWGESPKGRYAYSTSTLCELRHKNKNAAEEHLVVCLQNGEETRAIFRNGALMFLYIEATLYDDTTREFRSSQAKWKRLLQAVRGRLGFDERDESEIETPIDEEHVDKSREAVEKRRLKKEEKIERLGGKPVSKITRKMAERRRDEQ